MISALWSRSRLTSYIKREGFADLLQCFSIFSSNFCKISKMKEFENGLKWNYWNLELTMMDRNRMKEEEMLKISESWIWVFVNVRSDRWLGLVYRVIFWIGFTLDRFMSKLKSTIRVFSTEKYWDRRPSWMIELNASLQRSVENSFLYPYVTMFLDSLFIYEFFWKILGDKKKQ